MIDTTIILVDDHTMIRKGLRALIEKVQGLSVIGEAGNGLEAIELVRQHSPDIVVMDINMPELNGIDATQKIINECPDVKILALSIHSGKSHVEQMLKAGASGYLLKESAPEELVKAIHALKEGKGYLSSDITEIVLERLRQRPVDEEVNAELTAQKILEAKMLKPDLSGESVHRQELIDRLERGREKKLSLIVAPAGYGKSLLVSDWLTQCDQRSAWLSLDKSDNDLRQFYRSLLTAIRESNPDCCDQSLHLAHVANLPPVSVLAKALLDDLENVTQTCVLVLDNIEQVNEKSVHDLLTQLLNYPLRLLHLVLIGRQDPFLPLSSYRAANDMNELRMDNLRFSFDETKNFLLQTLKRDVDDETVELLLQRTDGWPAGLQHAADLLNYPEEVVPDPADAEAVVNWREILTNREYEVLLLLEQRMRDKEIANQLCISSETVKSHLKNLYGKLHATDRRDVIIKAGQKGLFTKKT